MPSEIRHSFHQLCYNHQPKLFPLKCLLTADHFKYEGNTHLSKAHGLVFSRDEVAIWVGRAPEVVSKLVLQRPRVLPRLRDGHEEERTSGCDSIPYLFSLLYKKIFYISRSYIQFYLKKTTKKQSQWLQSLESPCHTG